MHGMCNTRNKNNNAAVFGYIQNGAAITFTLQNTHWLNILLGEGEKITKQLSLKVYRLMKRSHSLIGIGLCLRLYAMRLRSPWN